LDLLLKIRRSAVSVASNIAEGAGRNTNGEFNQFLGIAYGSSCELDTQLIIANKLDFINDRTFEGLETDYKALQKMIFSLKKSIG
jgi:four helix bundle protein